MITSCRGLLVVLSGPSGVGKGTVVLKATSGSVPAPTRLRRSVSVTTRPIRPGETEGVDYFFRTPEKFEAMVGEQALLEWARYLDHRYGTPKDWVDQQLAAGYDVVLEIEVQGAMQVRRRRPDAVFVYMLPPSWEELARRLASRGSDREETQVRRLEIARQETAYLGNYDYVIVNDQVESAAKRLLAILEAERWRVNRLDVTSLTENDGG